MFILRQPRSLILIIFFCALILRLFGVFTYDLWFDELGTDLFTFDNIHRMAQLSHLDWTTIFNERMRNDPHSPLYYSLVYHVSQILGGGEVLRILSVVFSLLALGVFYKLSRVFFSQKVSIYALLIMAFNPFHVWYAQEARVYALASFLTLWMVYLYFKALKTDRWMHWIGFSLVGVLSFFCTYYSIFLMAILIVPFNFKDNQSKIKKWIVAMVVMAAIFLLFLPVFSSQFSFVKDDFWLPPPTPVMFLFTWLIFNLGYSAGIIQYSIGLVIFSILFVWGAYKFFKEDRAHAVLLLLLTILPILFIYFFSVKVMPLYINRQLLIFSPFYYLLIAKGIEGIPIKKDQTFVVVCILMLLSSCLFNYYRNYMFDHPSRPLYFTGVVPKKIYLSQLDFVNEHFKEGDLVAVTDTQAYIMVYSYLLKNSREHASFSFEHFRYYIFPKMIQKFENRFLRITNYLRMIPPEKYDQMQIFVPLPNGTMVLLEDPSADQAFNRLWLITSSWQNVGEETKILGLNSLNVRHFMDKNFKKTLKNSKDGVFVELYEK